MATWGIFELSPAVIFPSLLIPITGIQTCQGNSGGLELQGLEFKVFGSESVPIRLSLEGSKMESGVAGWGEVAPPPRFSPQVWTQASLSSWVSVFFLIYVYLHAEPSLATD